MLLIDMEMPRDCRECRFCVLPKDGTHYRCYLLHGPGSLFRDIAERRPCCPLKEAPSAQQERAKGHWIPVDSYSAFGGDEATWMAHGNPIACHYCSNCKKEARADEEGKDILSDFCPDCGADMRGEENG